MKQLLWLAAAMAALAQPPGTNYDEAKAGTYTLPDPLIMANGTAVRDAATWKRQRRPEVLALFESNVYGRSAPAPRRIDYEVMATNKRALGGLATRKEVAIWLTPQRTGPRMHVLFYIPNERKGPVPVFLGLNFGGNQAVTTEPDVPVTKNWVRPGKFTENGRATEASRGAEASRWQIEKVVRRGYAVASIYYGDIFPDHKDGLKDSIIPYFYKQGHTTPAADDWNAIGAWAWALSRALDYMEKDHDFDARRVAVWGHSRLGKTSLWAGAQDERFAMVISNNSGEGGASLARRNFGETVDRINTAFPHWFAANFKKYNQAVKDLPVDQHMLISLIAPRPVYIASALEDQWADPKGEFLSGLAADPVYRLLGTDGLAAKEMPGVHEPVMSRIGYHIRAGKHDVTEYDWEQFLNFADRHMVKK